MATPAYATDLTDITTSFTTNWSLISEGGGGQNALTAPETDDFIQGTQSVSRNPFSSSIRGVAYDRAAITVASGDAVFVWWKADVAAALDSFANGGVHICIGATLTDYKKFYVAGNDTYQLGGWRCTPIDPSEAGSLNRGTPGAAPYDTFGVGFDVPSTGPSKGFPFKCDMIRHGRDVEVTAGDAGDPATWAKLATYADVTSRRWGIVQGTPTGAEVQGRVFWGTASTSCYSRDSNRSIVLLNTLGFVPAAFTGILISNASTDLEWTNISILALDSENRGFIQVGNNATASFLGCTFTDLNTTLDGGTNSTWDGSTWRRCNAVTASGGTFVGCQVLASTVAANTSAFIYNQAASTSGILDGMRFSKGVNAHHAIEFGTASPTTINLNDLDFSGFGATNNANDSMLHIKRTSGTVTINLSGVTVNGGAGTVTYRTDGATVSLVASASLELTGLKNPTEVRVYDAGTTTEIAGQENVTTGTFSASIDSATYPSVDIAVLSVSYQNLRLAGVSMATDRSIPVAQQFDRQYSS